MTSWYVKALIALGIVAFFAIGTLTSVARPIDDNLLSKNTLAKAYLEKNGEDYAKCYNSINYGGNVATEVLIEYMYAGMPAASVQKIKAAEGGFMQKIKDQCQKSVDEYESNYKEYESSSAELEKSSGSLLSKLIGADTANDHSDINQYEPSLVRLNAGNPLTFHVFTQEDVAAYYKSQLGY